MAESFKTEIFELDEKSISITTSATESLPLVLVNTFAGKADSIWKECAALHCPPFTLACISGMDWNADLSPWEIPPIRKNDPPFSGKADSYLAFIVEQALPVILQKLSPPPYIALAGYSLAGLFALYAPYRTKIFSKIAAASPSVWYPKFIDFAKNSSFTNKPECIYLSLGDRESKTKNPRLASVQNNIIQLAEVYQSKNITTCFELNSGNHFTETDLRMAKAIKWILEK